jgi:hypothetical protein
VGSCGHAVRRAPDSHRGRWPPRGGGGGGAGGARPGGDAQAGALRRAGLRIAEPLRSVQLLDPDADAETIAREGYTVEAGEAAAFVCLAGVCLPPTSDPARLPELVARTAHD